MSTVNSAFCKLVHSTSGHNTYAPHPTIQKTPRTAKGGGPVGLAWRQSGLPAQRNSPHTKRGSPTTWQHKQHAASTTKQPHGMLISEWLQACNHLPLSAHRHTGNGKFVTPRGAKETHHWVSSSTERPVPAHHNTLSQHGWAVEQVPWRHADATTQQGRTMHSECTGCSRPRSIKPSDGAPGGAKCARTTSPYPVHASHA